MCGSLYFDRSVLAGTRCACAVVGQLANEKFDAMFRSPLARSHKTGEIIWGDRQQPVEDLPSLREVDLYSFQGLLKGEGKARFGEQFLMWQKDPDNFVIDDHYPVRCAASFPSVLYPPSLALRCTDSRNAVESGVAKKRRWIWFSWRKRYRGALEET